MCILRDTTFNQRQKICSLLQPRQLIDFLPFPSACGLTLCVWPGLDGNAARLVLGFSGSSTKFPDGPQPDSHNPRFRKPPLSSRTVGPACADRSPESGWRHSISPETLPIQPETQVLVHIRPLIVWFDLRLDTPRGWHRYPVRLVWTVFPLWCPLLPRAPSPLLGVTLWGRCISSPRKALPFPLRYYRLMRQS